MKSRPSQLVITSIVAVCSALMVSGPTANAGVLAFGTNSRGKTGMGTSSGYTDVATPIDATNLVGRKIVQAAAGNFHSLLLAEDGSAFSFGESDFGETGLGTTSGSASIATSIVTTNLGGRQIKQVAAGHAVSLLLADDGSVFSFGNNSQGQLGLGTTGGTVAIATPIVSTNLGDRNITQMAAGFWHSLLLADDGSVFSMGINVSGQTGLGTTTGNASIATPIDTTNLGGRKITQIAAGDRFSLLLAEDGSVFSFGSNASGQLGLGSPGERAIATPIDATHLGSRKITQIAAGYEHSLLLADDGSVFSFGENSSGQLGLGTSSPGVPVATPIDTTNLSGLKITGVSAGFRHSLILAEDGRVFSFGQNLSHQLGLGSTPLVVVPTPTPINTANLGGQIITHLDAGGFINLLITEPALPGDFNHDGVVDSADLVQWQGDFGASADSDADSDADNDNDSDGADFLTWQRQLGSGLPAASAPAVVPEPAALALAALGLFAVAPHRGRKVR